MKLFQLANTPQNCWRPRDTIILVDQIDGNPMVVIRTPWTLMRNVMDENFFLVKKRCRFSWHWIRKPDGRLIYLKHWTPVEN